MHWHKIITIYFVLRFQIGTSKFQIHFLLVENNLQTFIVRRLPCFGATKQNRTADLRVTNPLLYQLSYSGICTFGYFHTNLRFPTCSWKSQIGKSTSSL